MERILVPLDGSASAEAALASAVALAKSQGGNLVLFHAVLPSPSFFGPASDFTARERKKAERYLDGISRRLAREGVRTRRRVLSGDASRLLLRLVEREGVDAVVMSGRGRGGTSGGPLGSVAERVLRTSPVPVLVLRGPAPASPRIRTILLALDGIEHSMPAVLAAARVARAFGSTVALLHVGRRLKGALLRATDVLARLGVPIRVYLRSGRTAERIETVAAELGAGLVVLSARPPSPDRPLYLGDVLEEFLRRSKRPILVARRREAQREGGRRMEAV